MKTLVGLLGCFLLSGTVLAAAAPKPTPTPTPTKPKANLYIITNASTTLVASFSNIDECKPASESLVVRSAPVVSNGNAPSYVVSVCINTQ